MLSIDFHFSSYYVLIFGEVFSCLEIHGWYMYPFLNKAFVIYDSHSQNYLSLSNYLKRAKSCVSVFLGFFPVLVCPIGFYGIACNEICGNCRNVGQCHHITGACVSGCVAGYEGDICKTRE